jgi:hypothetical protein
MIKVKVRCWEFQDYYSDEKKINRVYTTYSEGFGGYWLMTCLSCGTIYAVDIEAELYQMPIDKKIKGIKCITCGKELFNNYAEYPNTYIQDNKKYSFKTPTLYPRDEDSIIMEFYSIYD